MAASGCSWPHPILLAEANLAALEYCNIRHIVVDEAHCVSEWGETFRPAYLQVGSLIRRLGVRMVSAFTATASPEVTERIRAHLFQDGEVRLVGRMRTDPESPIPSSLSCASAGRCSDWSRQRSLRSWSSAGRGVTPRWRAAVRGGAALNAGSSSTMQDSPARSVPSWRAGSSLPGTACCLPPVRMEMLLKHFIKPVLALAP